MSASNGLESIRQARRAGGFLVDHEKYGAVTLTDPGATSRVGNYAGTGYWKTFLVNGARLPLGRGARRGRGACRPRTPRSSTLLVQRDPAR
ncbi:hypothetical protein ABLN97_15480 [Mycobacterium tuberculosis]